jgi:RNA polymerase sigma-70 factor, ECF subfamily
LLRAHGDETLVAAMRRGDEAAFVEVVERYHPALARLARVYVSDHSVAEEVVQETWLAVLRGIRNFEGRSSFKTWLFRILINRAKTGSQREARSVSFSALDGEEPDEPTVDPDRFLPADHPQWPGGWATPPQHWSEQPEERALSREIGAQINAAIDGLPPGQREVITLRDVEGWGADEICNVLGITETNQRVLLHRARAKVRGALENYFLDLGTGDGQVKVGPRDGT